MLALLFDKILDQRDNPNQSVNTVQTNSYQEITLQRNRQGHYIFNGLINHKEVTFLVDTGATTTSIPDNLAAKLGLQRGYKFSVQTANGSSFAYSTKINSLQLGDMEFNNITASLNPGLQGSEILLGMNILKHLEMVQRGDTLILRK
ncbi:MAG: TIGR02281 family clan AA aspartic protease [Gammaproteobacteria bacterium]|nr:TIGR02281 family clan AA aspartic protease [Gammaproteobacteria bacterium]